tara:strand:- start:101 stop:1015 length:915 start_codon:yes stop_codon:yes gene_type:complete
MNKIIQIKNDFQLKNIKDSVHLKFLDEVSKSPIYVSKKTGLVYHPDILSSEKAVERWSNKIYSKKNNPKNELYTSDFPGMQSRHYFVIDFFRRFIKINKKTTICDFACGEGSLLLKLNQYFNIKNLFGTEHSLDNVKIIKKSFKLKKLTVPQLFPHSIENFTRKNPKLKFDIGVICWTLCNCSEPLEVVNALSKSIKKNGYIVIAESSRLMVPFKKVIGNYFNKLKKAGHYHPWHWSLNSLSNIFKIYGFELVKYNRYWDEDNLVLIFKNTGKVNENKIYFDNYKKISNFLIRWHKESKNYNFK